MIRSVEQYIESLNDGRLIYYLGEKIGDTTKVPGLRKSINVSAMDWVLANHPEYQDLFTVEEDGERYMFMWRQPKTAADLIRRRELYKTACRIGMGWGSCLHCSGADMLEAAQLTAEKIDMTTGTNYTAAVESYRQHLKDADVGISAALTDCKGDRGLHAQDQVQHKDFHVRVVERNADGIIVRGAKNLISNGPAANEIIVGPSHAHGESGADYALVFATPLNARGITMMVAPPETEKTGEEAEFDWPLFGRGGGQTECMIVFDDVFIPWNRVFMCGEWQYSREFAWTFAVFHRIFGTAHTVTKLEMKVGAAALMAEYNGIDKKPHVKEKLCWLTMHIETCDVISRAACEYPDIEPHTGLAVPNLVYSNLAKFKFANDGAEASKYLIDICGGILATVPSYKDWMNPEQRPLIEKYLAGKAGVPTEHRLLALRLSRDLTSQLQAVEEIHGEGSLAAQKMVIHASGDWDRYKAAAKRAAGIPGWEEHPVFRNLPEYPLKTECGDLDR
jgi:4-hydroxybutyryl-CoA dehydratase/vinylacetyl-CoA-Delta-isomerase